MDTHKQPIADQISKPEVVEFEDAMAVRQWRNYHSSGMSNLIGAMNLSYALLAFAQAGLADRLSDSAEVPTNELLKGVDAHMGSHLLRYLAIHKVLSLTGDRVRLTEHGSLLLSDTSLAQLGFYAEAYGPIVQKMSALLQNQIVYGRDVQRDGRALGTHCATLGSRYQIPVILTALEQSNAHYLLDIGCGGGLLLIEACQRYSTFRGVGLDISPAAIDVARELAEKYGVADRLDFVVADAFRPDTWPEICFRTDALSAVGVLHEQFRDGEQAVINILNAYSSLLRKGMKSFILGEPELYYDTEENDPDLFLVHIFTAQGFPRRQELWLELFERSELRCRRVFKSAAGPRFNFFDLIPA